METRISRERWGGQTSGPEPEEDRVDQGGGERRWSARALLKLGLLMALIATTLWIAYRLGVFDYRRTDALLAMVRDARQMPGFAGLFLLAYVVVIGLGLPVSIMFVIGGMLYGMAAGTLINWIGGTIGAASAYGLARLLGKPAVQMLLGRRGRTLEQYSIARGFSTLLRLRLLPFIPYTALNFAAAFAGIKARDYVLATAIGIIPIVLIYTFLAEALVSGIAGARGQAALYGGIAGGILVLLSFLPAVWRKRRD